MNILFVDDCPAVKVHFAIKYLESKNIEFSYTICKSQNSAMDYIKNNLENIDIAVVDLGLPILDDSTDGFGVLIGLSVIEFILKLNPSIPIIINSTTQVPISWLKHYFGETDNWPEHVGYLDGNYLYNYLENMGNTLI